MLFPSCFVHKATIRTTENIGMEGRNSLILYQAQINGVGKWFPKELTLKSLEIGQDTRPMTIRCLSREIHRPVVMDSLKCTMNKYSPRVALLISLL